MLARRVFRCRGFGAQSSFAYVVLLKRLRLLCERKQLALTRRVFWRREFKRAKLSCVGGGVQVCKLLCRYKLSASRSLYSAPRFGRVKLLCVCGGVQARGVTLWE